jgi:hypothetical protein
LLSAYNETVMQRIYTLLEPGPHRNVRNSAREREFTARALMVFLMGLHHMETLHPQLIGDRAWREFVASHVTALLGLNARQVRRNPAARGRAQARAVSPIVRREEQEPEK